MLYEEGKNPFIVVLDGVTDVRRFLVPLRVLVRWLACMPSLFLHGAVLR